MKGSAFPWVIVALLLAYSVVSRGCAGGAEEAAIAEVRTELADSIARVREVELAQARADSAAYAALRAAHADSSRIWTARAAEATRREQQATARAQQAEAAHVATLDSAQTVGFRAYVAERDSIDAAKDDRHATTEAELAASRERERVLFAQYNDLWGVLDTTLDENRELRLRGDAWQDAYEASRGQNRWLKLGQAAVFGLGYVLGGAT
jgi:hypothetical protein